MSVDATGEGNAVPQVVLDACEDYGAVDVLGPDGQSLKDPSGPTRYKAVVTVRNYADEGGWVVAESVSDGTTC